MTNKQTAGSK